MSVFCSLDGPSFDITNRECNSVQKKKVPNLFLVMIKTVSGPWLLNTCWCVLHFFFPCDVFYFSTEIPCLTLHQVMCKIFLTEL